MQLIIKIVFRRIKKAKLNLFINVFGLTVGMIAFTFIFSWIISEKSYDRFWDSADKLFRVELTRTGQGRILQNTAKNYNGVGPVLKNGLPEIEAATHLDKDIITVFTPGASVQNVDMFFTDSSFFKVFPRPLECDNPELLFADIHNAVISRSLARKLFGNKNPINKTFKLNEGWEFYIKAVFDDVPENSHVKFDLILTRKALFYYMRNFDYATGKLDNSKIASFRESDPYSQGQWNGRRGYTYIRLKDGCGIQQVKNKYAGVIAPCIRHIEQNNESVQFNFMPIQNVHLHSHKEGEMRANGSNIRVIAFSVVALLLIVTSILNYINLSVASSISNALEQGIHHVLGANRRHLVAGYIAESLFFNALAGTVSFIGGFILLRKGINIAGFEIFPVSAATICIICFLLIIVSTLICVAYPFLFSAGKIMSRKNQIKRDTSKASAGTVRALVVFQFGVSIFLIIGTIAIFRQLQYMQKTETGMDMEQTMVSFSPMTMIKKSDEHSKLETFRNEVQKIPGVQKFTTAEIVAGEAYKRSGNEVYLHGKEEDKYSFSIAHVDFNYFDYFDIKLINGSPFAAKKETNSNEVILNKLACYQLGLSPEEAVGKFLVAENRVNKIIGVVPDFHHQSLREAIEPVVFFNSVNWYRSVGYYFVKVAPGNMSSTISGVGQLWDKLYPEEKYHFSFLDDTFNEAYKADNNFGKAYLIFSILNILIASLGLLALAIFASKARMKEIGIRKVNGAKILEVMTMLNLDFVKWVAIAFVIATPIAWYAMHKWLENFAYKTTLSWWIFAMAGVLALGIALLTVSWQSWKAANRNPVESLRYE